MDMNEGSVKVPKEAKSVEHPAFTADSAGVLKGYVSDLQARGIADAEEFARDFVLTRYGEDGLQILNHAPDPRLEMLETPVEMEGDSSGRLASGEGGVVADPGAFAMSLSAGPGTLLNQLLMAKSIDREHGHTLATCLNSGKPTNRDWAAGQIRRLAGLHNRTVRMSLNSTRQTAKSDEQERIDYGLQLAGHKPAGGTQAMSLEPSPSLPVADPSTPMHPWGEPREFPGRGDDPVADANGRRLAGLK